MSHDPPDDVFYSDALCPLGRCWRFVFVGGCACWGVCAARCGTGGALRAPSRRARCRGAGGSWLLTEDFAVPLSLRLSQRRHAAAATAWRLSAP